MKRKETRTVAHGDPLTLADFVRARVSGEADAEACITRGRVRVDGRRVTNPTEPLSPGMRIIVQADAPRATRSFTTAKRDADVWVIDKPEGLLSQASESESEITVAALAEAKMPGAHVVHRLDRDASGLMLVALTARARQRLQAALDERAIERRYLAIVDGKLEGEGRITHAIGIDPADKRRRRALPDRDPAGQPAESAYRSLGGDGAYTAVELTLATGRTHQLRVHLAALGHPIVGDTLYGGSAADRLYLHAYRLVFPHPRNGESCVVTSPTPSAFLSLCSSARWP